MVYELCNISQIEMLSTVNGNVSELLFYKFSLEILKFQPSEKIKKVMSGDTINMAVQSYYNTNSISAKIKSRLIYEVIDEKKFYSLMLYNKTFVSLDKTLIPLYKDRADYYLNSLFGVGGTINLTPSKSERYIVEIDNKKYYFLPFLFEEEVLI